MPLQVTAVEVVINFTIVTGLICACIAMVGIVFYTLGLILVSIIYPDKNIGKWCKEQLKAIWINDLNK